MTLGYICTLTFDTFIFQWYKLYTHLCCINVRHSSLFSHHFNLRIHGRFSAGHDPLAKSSTGTTQRWGRIAQGFSAPKVLEKTDFPSPFVVHVPIASRCDMMWQSQYNTPLFCVFLLPNSNRLLDSWLTGTTQNFRAGDLGLWSVSVVALCHQKTISGCQGSELVGFSRDARSEYTGHFHFWSYNFG